MEAMFAATGVEKVRLGIGLSHRKQWRGCAGLKQWCLVASVPPNQAFGLDTAMTLGFPTELLRH